MSDLDEETMDLNIDNYTIDELLLVYNIDTTATKNEIYAKSLLFLERFKGEDKKEFYDFFVKARDKLVEFVESTYDFDEEYSLLITKEDESNIDPAHINTNKQILENRYVFDDRDSNIVVNKVMKTIVINTTHLTNSDKVSNFTFDLSDTLYDVLNLSLYSYSIPYSWYNINDETYSNNMFIINHNFDSSKNKSITISNGNYTASQLIQVIQNTINDVNKGIGMREATEDEYITIKYNEYNGKCEIIFNYSDFDKIIFYDGTFGSANKNLGYTLGFRNNIYERTTEINTYVSQSIVSTNGTKYLQIYLDDFQNNRLPSNLLNTYDDNYNKIDNNHIFDNIQRSQDINSATFDYVIPYRGSNLTKNQIYAINSIERAKKDPPKDACGNEITSNIFNSTPTTDTDLFAIIHPFSNQTTRPNIGDILTSSDISLPYNKRIYFGPTNISRLHIKLLDEWGNEINLNGQNYSISLLCECLYKKPK